MAEKKIKPIAVIYEMAFVPENQKALLLFREHLQKSGYRVVVQNPACYSSAEKVHGAKIVFLFESSAHAEKILADYEDAAVKVIVFASPADVKKETDKIKTVAEAEKQKKAEAEAKKKAEAEAAKQNSP